MVPKENATNLMDYKEIKRNSATRSSHIKITRKWNIQTPGTFFFLSRDEKKLEHLVTTGMSEEKHSRGDCEKDVSDE